MKRQEKMQKILEKVKGTKNISNIKSVKKRILIPKVKNKEGETVKTRQGIANVFLQNSKKIYMKVKEIALEWLKGHFCSSSRSLRKFCFAFVAIGIC